jgi:hypothetical protein
MAFTASSAQQAALPTQTTAPSTTVTSTGLLINGASIGPATPQQATADEITFVGILSGTLQSDSTVEIQVSQNGTNYGAMYTFTNAQIQNSRGFAAVVKVGIGNYFRIQFVAGSTTGGGNGVTVRFRN